MCSKAPTVHTCRALPFAASSLPRPSHIVQTRLALQSALLGGRSFGATMPTASCALPPPSRTPAAGLTCRRDIDPDIRSWAGIESGWWQPMRGVGMTCSRLQAITLEQCRSGQLLTAGDRVGSLCKPATSRGAPCSGWEPWS